MFPWLCIVFPCVCTEAIVWVSSLDCVIFKAYVSLVVHSVSMCLYGSYCLGFQRHIPRHMFPGLCIVFPCVCMEVIVCVSSLDCCITRHMFPGLCIVFPCVCTEVIVLCPL